MGAGMLQEALRLLSKGQDLPDAVMEGAVEQLTSGQGDPVQAAGFLMGLRLKGETAEELAAAVRVLRRHMVVFDTGTRAVADTCGTGGDGSNTFNISTAAALVVAACGLPVVKHGNRAVSSSSGSADVLSYLGVRIEAPLATWRTVLDAWGFAFCFAPHFHPGMRHVADVRRILGVRTVFNLLGPLLNPARPVYQLLGVAGESLQNLLADTIERVDFGDVALVCGAHGLDEVSLAGPTRVLVRRQGRWHQETWTPEGLGLPELPTDAIRVHRVEQSAALMEAVLRGQDGPSRYWVLANAGATLWLAGRAESVREGIEQAARVLDDGFAWHVLERIVRATQ